MNRTLEKGDISIVSWNVEGLSTCLTDNEFLNFVTQFDLIFWQRPNDKFNIEVYNCICVPRPDSMGRNRCGHVGICFLINETIADGIEIIEK